MHTYANDAALDGCDSISLDSQSPRRRIITEREEPMVYSNEYRGYTIHITKGCERGAQAHPVSRVIWNMRAASPLSSLNLAQATHFVRNLEEFPRDGGE